MSEFERSVWKDISDWQSKVVGQLVDRPIQKYWEDYINSCKMGYPETGLEVF